MGGVSYGYGYGAQRRKPLLSIPISVPLPTVPVYGFITATKDGSTGQTYTLNAPWTAVQWSRASLIPPYAETTISGATSSTYVAQAADENSRLVCRGKSGTTDMAAKAIHVVFAPPILLEAFTSTSGVTASGNAVLSTEATGQAPGFSRLKVTGTGTASPGFEKTNIGTFDPATFGTIAELVDVGFDPVYTATNSIRLNFTRSGTSYPTAADYPLNPLYTTPSPQFYGTMWSSRHVSELGTLSTIGSGQLGIVQQSGTSSNSNAYTNVGFHGLLAKAGGRPTIIIGFDDTAVTQYTVAYPYMAARGLKGCIAVVPGYMDQSGRMTSAMMQELYNAGWDANLNSTDDGPFTGKGTVQAALDDLAACKTYCQNKGWTRGNDFFVYPNGSYQVSPTRPLISSVTTNGTTTATMGSTSGIVAGMHMGGFNVPTGTTVVSVDSATQVTLSNAVPAATKPANFVDLTSPFSYTKLPLAFKAAGYKIGRTTQNRGGFLSRFGITDRGGVLAPGNGVSGSTLDASKTLIDNAILRGETLEFYIHGINAQGGINTDEAKFYGLIDYITEKRDAGLLDVLTKSEVWARDGGSSVPVTIPATVPAKMDAPTLVAGSPNFVTANRAAYPNDGGSPITGWNMQIRTVSAGVPAAWAGFIGTTDTTMTSRTYFNRTEGVFHQVRTQAVNAVGAGDWSDASNLAAPFTAFSDDFNRTDRALETDSASYVVRSGSNSYNMGTVNNILRSIAGTGYTDIVPLFASDMEVEWQARAGQTNNSFLCVRQQENGDYLGIRTSNLSQNVFTFVGGAYTALLTVNGIQNDMIVKFLLIGNEIRLYQSGALVGSATIPTALATGNKVGFHARSVNVQMMDNLRVRPLSQFPL